MPHVLKRIEHVRKFRLSSSSKPTQILSNTPTRFHIENLPDSDYIIVPRVSSERRKYIPIGFLDKNTITSDSALIIPHATLYEFGVLTSIMHMTWMKFVCGKLESRYRYSNKIVYNNYPWPHNPIDKKREKVKSLAQKVLDTRKKYPDCSLAVLYNPETMPADLTKAHHELDKAVDACYGKKAFSSDTERMEFLFDLYEQYTAPLTNVKKARRNGNKERK